jgi:OFA family oxalate/formate antiporter-like MFS transporter
MSERVSRVRTMDTARWYRLAACIIAMMAVANLQYAWTLFVPPLMESLHATLSTVQVAFTCFVVTQAFLLPATAYLIDRVGARLIISCAAFLVGLSWILCGLAGSLPFLYFASSIGGIGAGGVYGGCIGLAMKWFPDRRGFCVGLVAGAYGFGTALTAIPISQMISTNGYRAAFITWGIVQWLVILVAAQFLISPPEGWFPAGWEQTKARIQSRVQQSARDYTAGQMMRTKAFYALYVMMTVVAFSGLMVMAQLAPIAKTFHHDTYVLFGGVTVLGLTMVLDGVLNGITRPLFGWVSDNIGRYDTMAISFGLEAVAIIGLTFVGGRAGWFIVLTGMTFFAWGEIYSLFPSAIADLFGSKYATTNFSIQYTAKGVASVLAGPLAAWITEINGGSWLPVLWAAIVGNLVAAFLALFWLKSTAARQLRADALGATHVSPDPLSEGESLATDPTEGSESATSAS